MYLDFGLLNQKTTAILYVDGGEGGCMYLTLDSNKGDQSHYILLYKLQYPFSSEKGLRFSQTIYISLSLVVVQMEKVSNLVLYAKSTITVRSWRSNGEKERKKKNEHIIKLSPTAI